MDFTLDSMEVNGEPLGGNPVLVEQTNTLSEFGLSNSYIGFSPHMIQLIACAMNPDEPATFVWEFPVTLVDGVNTLSWSYSDQNIMPFGSAPRTFDIQFGACPNTSP